ncbi:glycosyltransferase [Paracoccus aerius]
MSAPWSDTEGLFRDGDFRWAQDGDQMRAHLRELVNDPAARAEQAARGWKPFAPATLAPIAPANCWPSSTPCPPAKGKAHEDRLLRIQPSVGLLERGGDLLPRDAQGTGRTGL